MGMVLKIAVQKPKSTEFLAAHHFQQATLRKRNTVLYTILLQGVNFLFRYGILLNILYFHGHTTFSFKLFHSKFHVAYKYLPH